MLELHDKYVELNKFVISILNVAFTFKYKKGFLMCILNINQCNKCHLKNQNLENKPSQWQV